MPDRGDTKPARRSRVDFLSKQFSGQPAGKNIPIDGPAGTVTTIDHHAFVSAYYGNGYNSPVERPAPTLTTKDRFQLVQPFITNYYSGGGQLSGVNEPTGALLTNPKQRIVNAHYLLNPQYRSAGGSVDAPCFTLIARMDKRPPYLVSIEQGVPAWTIKPDDIPEMVRVKEFCILYGIVDVTMPNAAHPRDETHPGIRRRLRAYRIAGGTEEIPRQCRRHPGSDRME